MNPETLRFCLVPDLALKVNAWSARLPAWCASEALNRVQHGRLSCLRGLRLLVIHSVRGTLCHHPNPLPAGNGIWGAPNRFGHGVAGSGALQHRARHSGRWRYGPSRPWGRAAFRPVDPLQVQPFCPGRPGVRDGGAQARGESPRGWSRCWQDSIMAEGSLE